MRKRLCDPDCGVPVAAAVDGPPWPDSLARMNASSRDTEPPWVRIARRAECYGDQYFRVPRPGLLAPGDYGCGAHHATLKYVPVRTFAVLSRTFDVTLRT